jgi:hypothetical protein
VLEATRTAGGHRRITREAALRFVRERNGQLARPDKLGFDTAAFTLSARLSLDDAAEHAYDYLAEGLGDKLHALMTALYMRGFTVAEIADEVIRTAMSRIGMLWQGDPGGIFIEHRATFQCLTAIEELRALRSADSHGRCGNPGGGRR